MTNSDSERLGGLVAQLLAPRARAENRRTQMTALFALIRNDAGPAAGTDWQRAYMAAMGCEEMIRSDRPS